APLAESLRRHHATQSGFGHPAELLEGGVDVCFGGDTDNLAVTLDQQTADVVFRYGVGGLVQIGFWGYGNYRPRSNLTYCDISRRLVFTQDLGNYVAPGHDAPTTVFAGFNHLRRYIVVAHLVHGIVYGGAVLHGNQRARHHVRDRVRRTAGVNHFLQRLQQTANFALLAFAGQFFAALLT